VVLRLDLEDFFASVEAPRIYGIFRTAGYPESVAHSLTALVTNAAPEQVLAELPPSPDPAQWRMQNRLRDSHLPQGAPTSPALANLCAFRLDVRLAGLATKLGATYTRYADDMVFSGDHRLKRAAPLVKQIATAEGFRVNERKTAFATRAGRQRVTGIVVNEKTNVAREEYDRLKAILHSGAAGEDPARLLGRISWVESLNPKRGAKLRERLAALEL
jgi:retron-type reverse transcriptase